MVSEIRLAIPRPDLPRILNLAPHNPTFLRVTHSDIGHLRQNQYLCNTQCAERKAVAQSVG